MSLSVVILAATSKIAPIDESSPCMKVISKSDMAEWNAWWYEYRWVVVGMLMPLFLGVMRMVMNDIISMTMLAMCRVRGRLPQGRAARPYHWHTMRPAVVAVVAKIVVVDGLWALAWWVSKQVAANFLSGWREVLCWSVVLGSGAYMRSYTLGVMSSVTNGMVAVGAWVYSTGFHQRSPGRGAESPRWHPFRAATAIFTAGLVAMVVDRIAETGGWSASVVRAAGGVTAFRGRLPLTFQLVSVSWRTLGVAAAAAGLMAWVMVVYVAAAGIFFVCTNRMTFPIRILVRVFELYDKWGEPSTLQLALRVGLHRNVLCHAHGTDASLKAAVFSVLSRLEPGDDYTQVLLVARSFQDECDLSVRFHEFAARTDTPMTVSMALHPDWQQEVRSQVVIGTASTLSILLDRGLLDPSNVTVFAVDLGNDDSSLQEERRSSARALFSVWAFAALCYAGYWVLPLAFPSFTSSATAFLWELFAALGRVAVSTAGLVATLLCGLSALLVHATTVILVLPSFTAGLLAATVGLVGDLLRRLFTSLVHPSTVIRVFSSFVGGLPAATAGVFATLWCGLSAVVVYVTTIIRVLTPYVGGLAAATAEVVVILSQALFAVVVPATATVIRGLSVCAYGLVGLLKIVVSLWSELAVTAMAGRLLWILGRQEQRLSTPATATLAVASCRAASNTTNTCVPKGKVDGSAASNTTNTCVPKGKVDGSAASNTTNTCVPKGKVDGSAASNTTNTCVPKGKVDGSAASNTTNTCVPKGKVDGSAASNTTNTCVPKGKVDGSAASNTTNTCVPKGKVDGSAAPASGSALPGPGSVFLAENSPPPLLQCAPPLAPQPSVKPQGRVKTSSTQTAPNLCVCLDVVAQPTSKPQRSLATSSTQTPTASWVSTLVPRGITNRSETICYNRCFLNSVVQLLRASPGLVSLLLRESKVGPAARLLEGGRLWSDPAPRTLEELQNDLLFQLAMVLKIEDWEGCASHACPAFYHAEEKKTLKLGTSPQSLLVPINRNVTGSKITRDVTFPLDDLELITSEADGTPTTTHYMAVAVMQHWGPYCTSGHNVTLVRKDSKAGSEWWLCNDEEILSVSSACVTRNAVVVLYRRVPDS
ncbi:unnamed protein product [Ectocarpus sp. 12 AP-2014]